MVVTCIISGKLHGTAIIIILAWIFGQQQGRALDIRHVFRHDLPTARPHLKMTDTHTHINSYARRYLLIVRNQCHVRYHENAVCLHILGDFRGASLLALYIEGQHSIQVRLCCIVSFNQEKRQTDKQTDRNLPSAHTVPINSVARPMSSSLIPVREH